MEFQNPTPAATPLSPVEARVLASLIEKQANTPDVYPLTVNAVVAACNQKTNRDPVLELEPGVVGHALRELEGRGLVAGSMSSRASRYEHRFDQGYGVTPRQRAVLAVLMLRGPQTLAEIFLRSDRLADFSSADDVRAALDRLIQREPALVVDLGRGAGQREGRYMHLLSGPAMAASMSRAATAPEAVTCNETNERIDALERSLETLQQRLTELEGQLFNLNIK